MCFDSILSCKNITNHDITETEELGFVLISVFAKGELIIPTIPIYQMALRIKGDNGCENTL